MALPSDTITIEKAEKGYVARTSLLDDVEGRGHSEAEAKANLELAVRAYVRMADDLDKEVPEELRRPITIKRALYIVIFLLIAFMILVVAGHLGDMLR